MNQSVCVSLVRVIQVSLRLDSACALILYWCSKFFSARTNICYDLKNLKLHSEQLPDQTRLQSHGPNSSTWKDMPLNITWSSSSFNCINFNGMNLLRLKDFWHWSLGSDLPSTLSLYLATNPSIYLRNNEWRDKIYFKIFWHFFQSNKQTIFENTWKTTGWLHRIFFS